MKRFANVVFGLAVMSSPIFGKTIEGFTQPYETVNLAAPESGIIQTLTVRQGSDVAAGQTVGTLDNAVLLASLEATRAKAESKGPMLAAEAAHRQRASRLTHILKLRGGGHASPEEVERAEADAQISLANLATAREEARANALAVKQFEAQLAKRTIQSPLSGVVSKVAKRPGEFVSATDPAVLTIVQVDRLRVVFQIPTERIASLHVEDVVQVRFKSTSQIAEASVDFISPITDAQSNLVRVEVVIPNRHGRYRSGVRCELIAFERLRRPATSGTAPLPQASKPATTHTSLSGKRQSATMPNLRRPKNRSIGARSVTR